jgi:hypothetical protein
MRRTTLIAAAIALAVPSLASAEPEYRYDHSYNYNQGFRGERERLTEVSADPRDGADFVQLPTRGRFAYLELRARADRVRLHSVQVQFVNGRFSNYTFNRVLMPGESQWIAIPRAGRFLPINALIIDYGDPRTRWQDRTPARLEIYGVRAGYGRYDRGYWDRRGWDRDHDSTQPYEQPYRTY